MKYVQTPFTAKDIAGLKAGDEILLSGSIYTARDQAHKKLVALIEGGKKLPIDLKEAVIYYCGPTPAPRGMAIGSCGPTTSSRMDPFSPVLIEHGNRIMIGKGNRSPAVVQAIKRYKALYLLSYGGCGAVLQERVIKNELIAFPELGPEAIYRIDIKEFPLIVGIDSKGNNLLK